MFERKLQKGQNYGFDDEANALRTKTLELVTSNDVVREYYSSLDGHGEGAENYMWTAALFCDLILMGESNSGSSSGSSSCRLFFFCT